jgi:Xaa-Pro dipeptidase
MASMAISNLIAWLDEHGVDAACVTRPVSIAYLTGFRAEPHERLLALAIVDGSPVLVVPELEAANAERAVKGVEIVGWADGDDAMATLRRVLGSPKRVGVEKDHLTVDRAEAIAAPELVDCGAPIRALRARKSEAELGLLARACELTDEVTKALFVELQAGTTERAVAARVDELIRATGAQLSFATLVQSGPNSALPHAGPSERRLELGDLVLFDFGCRWRGFNGDTTRMAAVGEPNPRQHDVHRLVVEAHDAAIAAIRAGVTCGAVDAAARAVIEKAGYGEAFIHRTGHGLGLEAHEEPNLSPGSDVVLEEGNVVTVEPGIYIPGWGGVRIEDDVAVERDGARLLTAADRSLMVISPG